MASYPYEVQRITLKDDSQVNLSAEDLERVRQENQKIAGLWDLSWLRRWTPYPREGASAIDGSSMTSHAVPIRELTLPPILVLRYWRRPQALWLCLETFSFQAKVSSSTMGMDSSLCTST